MLAFLNHDFHGNLLNVDAKDAVMREPRERPRKCNEARPDIGPTIRCLGMLERGAGRRVSERAAFAYAASAFPSTP
jgi:hypothetical protein